MGPLELVARALVTRLDILDQFQSEKLRTNGGGEKRSRADLRCLLEFVASCLVVYWFPLFDLFIPPCAIYVVCWDFGFLSKGIEQFFCPCVWISDVIHLCCCCCCRRCVTVITYYLGHRVLLFCVDEIKGDTIFSPRVFPMLAIVI